MHATRANACSGMPDARMWPHPCPAAGGPRWAQQCPNGTAGKEEYKQEVLLQTTATLDQTAAKPGAQMLTTAGCSHRGQEGRRGWQQGRQPAGTRNVAALLAAARSDP